MNMFSQYKNLQIVQRDMYFYAYRDGMFDKVLFKQDAIPTEYHNLVAAAPVMYAHISTVCAAAGAMVAVLESVTEALAEGEEKQLRNNIITLLSQFRRNGLTAMRIAEVGQRKVSNDFQADKNN